MSGFERRMRSPYVAYGVGLFAGFGASLALTAVLPAPWWARGLVAVGVTMITTTLAVGASIWVAWRRAVEEDEQSVGVL